MKQIHSVVKSFAIFSYTPGVKYCCTFWLFICISESMQSTESKIALVLSCGACLQAALQGSIGQGQIWDLLHKISKFLNKKIFLIKKNGENHEFDRVPCRHTLRKWVETIWTTSSFVLKKFLGINYGLGIKLEQKFWNFFRPILRILDWCFISFWKIYRQLWGYTKSGVFRGIGVTHSFRAHQLVGSNSFWIIQNLDWCSCKI